LLTDLKRSQVNAYSLGSASDLFHGRGAAYSSSIEWIAATVVGDLLAKQVAARAGRYGTLVDHLAEGLMSTVPEPLRNLPALALTEPLARARLPAPALQLLLWAIECLGRGIALASSTTVAGSKGGQDEASSGEGSSVGGFFAVDEFGDARKSIPCALGTLVGLQLALEAVSCENRLNRFQGRGGHQQGLPEFDALAGVLDSTLTLAMRELGHVLPIFAFPPQYAKRLRKYAALS